MWPRPDDFRLARAVVVRGVGLCALIAFVSLLVQVKGLVGERGILPAQTFFERVASRLDVGERLLHLPSLFWLTGAGNGWLVAYCVAGAVAAAFAIADRFATPALVVAYALYLSLCGAGQIFLGYQWDILLCEALVVAALVSPRRFSPFALLAAWVLAARLEMGSGLSKLLSGDETWRALTALEFHFETQPLPTPLGWLAHHLPTVVLDGSCLVMFVLQLAAPPLLFVPWRRVRTSAVVALTLLQAGIAATGNYTFFNILTAVLALSAVDDATWKAVARVVTRNRVAIEPRAHGLALLHPAAQMAQAAAACALALLGVCAQWSRLSKEPVPVDGIVAAVQPFEIAGGYGLFANMTTERNEIVVEGTLDGTTWLPYAFKHKPGDLDRMPDFTAPHQPRLDWQMWFAALGSPRQNPWFTHFVQRLREAEPDVLALLDDDPFHGQPPQQIRATFWRYTIAPIGSGNVWNRELIGEYGH